MVKFGQTVQTTEEKVSEMKVYMERMCVRVWRVRMCVRVACVCFCDCDGTCTHMDACACACMRACAYERV